MPYLIQRLLAALGLILLFPLTAAVSLALLIAQGMPVIYRGERFGRDARAFQQFKFRTMVNNADAMLVDGVASAPRVTRLGRVLRKTSLDEIPQLWNVVKGDMALVGPRPLIDVVMDRVPSDHSRFKVLPGITGLAQVNGRNELAWSERLRLDDVYATERSFLFDLRLLFRTVHVTIRGSGIAADRNPDVVLDL